MSTPHPPASLAIGGVVIDWDDTIPADPWGVEPVRPAAVVYWHAPQDACRLCQRSTYQMVHVNWYQYSCDLASGENVRCYKIPTLSSPSIPTDTNGRSPTPHARLAEMTEIEFFVRALRRVPAQDAPETDHNHGTYPGERWLTRALASCKECDWFSESMSAMHEASAHTWSTGHQTTGEQCYTFRCYPQSETK